MSPRTGKKVAMRALPPSLSWGMRFQCLGHSRCSVISLFFLNTFFIVDGITDISHYPLLPIPSSQPLPIRSPGLYYPIAVSMGYACNHVHSPHPPTPIPHPGMSVWSMSVIATEGRNFLALGHFPPPSPLPHPNVDFTNNPISQKGQPFFFCPARSYTSPRKSKK